MDSKAYMIQIRGHIPEMRRLEFIGNNASDFYFGNGYIRYKGTSEGLDNLLRGLMKDETYFKVIGIFDDDAFNGIKDMVYEHKR